MYLETWFSITRLTTIFSVSFLAYDCQSFDGSLLLWNSTDDHIVITHINQEDDEGSVPRESRHESRYRMKERIFGRNVDQNIHSISPPDHGKSMGVKVCVLRVNLK